MALSNVVLVQYTTLEVPVAPVQTQQYPDRTSYNGNPVNLDLGDPYWSSNVGAMEYTDSGLPTGLTMDAAGQVTGTPSANGSTSVTITATNSAGPTNGNAFSWNIIDAPVVDPADGSGLSLSLSLFI